MVETVTGKNRSNGITYNEVALGDAVPPPDVYLEESPMKPGVTKVKTDRFFSKEAHDLEVERLWKRVWQMACHEDDIPNVGDTHVYDIASLSFLIVRVAEDEVKAFPNSCMHRGRALCDADRKGLKVLRCPFHGWSWALNGELKEVPCEWDFPTITKEEYSLPKVSVGHWGGFIFINPDPDCEPLEDFIGDFDRHFKIPFKQRYKAAHLVKRLACNWKVAQDAFMESYHVVGTHPELMPTFADANSKYDVWGNYARAISATGPTTPHVDEFAPGYKPFPDDQAFQSFLHPISGHLFERLEENRVKVTDKKGNTGVFDMYANHIEGDMQSADPHMCNWIAGKIKEGEEAFPAVLPHDDTYGYRAARASAFREMYRPSFGDHIDTVSDSDFNDAIFYNIFPNISPWADFNPIFYRFRPDGDNPEQCLHEVLWMVPLPEGAERPPSAKPTFIDLDGDYTEAPGFSSYLLKVFNQDALNHPMVQKGMHSQPKGEIIFASYQESKLRHFYENLDNWLASETAPKSK